jgi:hypothetical protein
VSAEASGVPRPEPESLESELMRLHRGVALARIEADPGLGDDALVFTRQQLAEVWHEALSTHHIDLGS